MNLRTIFHPQTDGQADRTIHTLEDILRAYVIDFKGNWDDHIPLIEFDNNNSCHPRIQMCPYKAFCVEDADLLMGGSKLVKHIL